MSIESICNPGLTLAFDDKSSAFAHEFCGVNPIPGATCPNCNQPLLKILTLDLADPRIGLANSDFQFLHLFFCWRCPLSEGFAYKVLQADIDIIRYRKGNPETDFPYKNYPTSFPAAPCSLTPISDDLQSRIRQSNEQLHNDSPPEDDLDPIHLIGGEPLLMQPNSLNTQCPECNQPTKFLAAIADSNTDPRGFTDNPFVMMTFNICTDCNIVVTGQQCD